MQTVKRPGTQAGYLFDAEPRACCAQALALPSPFVDPICLSDIGAPAADRCTAKLNFTDARVVCTLSLTGLFCSSSMVCT